MALLRHANERLDVAAGQMTEFVLRWKGHGDRYACGYPELHILAAVGRYPEK